MFYNFHSLKETLTSFKSTKIEFKLGEEFDEFTADGRDCKTIATVEGRKLIKVRINYSFVQFDQFDQIFAQVQTPDPSTGYHTTREVREWSEEGDMTLHLEIPAKPEIVCKRGYKKVEPVEEAEGEGRWDTAR